jgi:folate-dependent phosphoribosylglycinamide formyltransferase PurN
VEERVHEVEHRLLPEAVRLLARGRVKLDPSGGRRVVLEEATDGDD